VGYGIGHLPSEAMKTQGSGANDMCKSQQSNLSAENNPTTEGKFSCIYLIKKDVKPIREYLFFRPSM
jgi:hypothetical protein